MKTLTRDDVPALMGIYEQITGERYDADFRKYVKIDQLPTSEVEDMIASVFGIASAAYLSSMDAAYSLLDEVSAGEDYVNVDFREYRKNGYVICDINRDYGSSFEGSCRNGSTRRSALVGAIINALIAQIEYG